MTTQPVIIIVIIKYLHCVELCIWWGVPVCVLDCVLACVRVISQWQYVFYMLMQGSGVCCAIS